MLMRGLTLSIVALQFAVAGASAEDKVDYEKQIQPIFLQHCAGCHGEKKASGRMRLHTAAELKKKWDADKELIVPGEPEKSELYQRITLPADNKKRMPQKADPLPKETIDLIARWIKEGAVLSVAAAVEPAKPPAAATPAEAPAKEEKPADLPLPEVAAAPQEALDALTAAGAQVLPLFAESKLLQISFGHGSEPAGDAQLALLSPVAEQVYALNLADAKPSDAGLAPLAALKNLSVLHLERSAVTDAGLAHLKGLANLQYLNLFGTNITDAGVTQLAGLKNLRRLYLWQTKVSYEAAMGMEKDIPGLAVNLGYDHPAVVKMRLTKELELVKKQADEAKSELAKAEQQLEGAKKNAEAVGARLAEVEKQLKELEQPAEKPGDPAQPAAPAAGAEAKTANNAPATK
jgi:mono/diheme cytochrome c family protein